MKTVNVGLIGLGTVGAGTLEILQRNAAEISGRTGCDIRVTRIAVRDALKPRPVDTTGIDITENPIDIANDPKVQIVAELIGGDSTALQAVMTSLSNGKHVVTANKALIAMHGNDIFAEAAKQGITVAFESAVAGGIPIIKAIREGLSGNRNQWLAGIINGTCNYILTRMEAGGLDFATVLKDAQDMGYAEADPTFDIEGIDAAHKLTILASIAFGTPLDFDNVHVEGITGVTIEDIHYADELGFRIKHLGIARKTEKGIEMRVHPAMIPHSCLIAKVDGVMNAVLVQSDAVGQSLYCGAGAGAAPTGSAVVADIIDVARNIDGDNSCRVPPLSFGAEALQMQPVVAMGDIEAAYYLRMKVVNVPGVLAAITKIFGDADISIETIVQKGHETESGEVTIIILTRETLESNLDTAVSQVKRLDAVTSSVTSIRMETLS